MPIPIDLSGKKALVSGVTSGIGLEIARVLAAAGCDIAGCGRSSQESEGAQQFHSAVTQKGRKSYYSSIDLSKKGDADRWIEEGTAHLQGIDILISNAGRNIFKGAAECSEADWEECMELDLASHWRIAKAAKPFLDQSGQGIVIVITSNHSWNTIPGCFPYNVAKAGLLGLVQSFAIEWGPRIRAVGIAPGFIQTAGNETWFNSFQDPQAERHRTEQIHPLHRLGRSDEIGNLCAFLASPLCGFITGTTLCVDGGRSALLQDS